MVSVGKYASLVRPWKRELSEIYAENEYQPRQRFETYVLVVVLIREDMPTITLGDLF